MMMVCLTMVSLDNVDVRKTLFFFWLKSSPLKRVLQQLSHQFNGYLQGFLLYNAEVFLHINSSQVKPYFYLLWVFQSSRLPSRISLIVQVKELQVYTRRVVVLTLQRGVLADGSAPGAATLH